VKGNDRLAVDAPPRPGMVRLGPPEPTGSPLDAVAVEGAHDGHRAELHGEGDFLDGLERLVATDDLSVPYGVAPLPGPRGAYPTLDRFAGWVDRPLSDVPDRDAQGTARRSARAR